MPLAARQALFDFLKHPAVAIRVAEGGERKVGSALRIWTWRAIRSAGVMREATSAVEDVTHVHATSEEIGTRRVKVLYGERHVDNQTGCGVLDARAKADRGEGARRRKLHDAKVIG